MATAKTSSLETLKLHLASTEAQIAHVQSDRTDPIEDRRRAVVAELLDKPDDEALLAEFSKIESAHRPALESKAKRLEALYDRQIELQALLRDAEQKIIDDLSFAQRKAAVTAAKALLPLATAWDKAANALTDATQAFYAAMPPVVDGTMAAMRAYYKNSESKLQAYSTAGQASRGATGEHAQAIAALIAKIMQISPSESLSHFVELSRYAPAPPTSTMAKAVTDAANTIGDVLNIERAS